jgi:hypothetical protein
LGYLHLMRAAATVMRRQDREHRRVGRSRALPPADLTQRG